MKTVPSTVDHTWEDLPHECMVEFLDPVETLICAQLCTSSRAAAKAVHGGKVPPMKTTYMLELVSNGRLAMIKWVRAQKPPCPCDFTKCRRLAKEGGAVWAYFQMGLDLLSKCEDTRLMRSKAGWVGVVALIDQGADVNAKKSDGHTSLHYACWNGHAEVAMALVEKGAEVNAKTSHGRTPLHWACMKGHTVTAIALLEKGADVNVKTNGGWTPLCCARPEHGGREKLFAILLEKGAVCGNRDL